MYNFRAMSNDELFSLFVKLDEDIYYSELEERRSPEEPPTAENVARGLLMKKIQQEKARRKQEENI